MLEKTLKKHENQNRENCKHGGNFYGGFKIITW